MSGLIELMIPLSGLLLGAAARQAGKRGKRFSRRQLEGFAADLRRELYSRASLSGEWIDIGDYVSRQPYFPGTWFISIYHILYKQGVVANPTPRMTPGGARIKLTDKALEEARGERMVAASEQPRTVQNIQAGVVQIGDHNRAHHVSATFGTDQSALLAQLVAALTDVARNAELPLQLRQAAEGAATELQQSEPSRIPAILERLRGIASVAARGFEAVSPILDALRTVVS